MVDDLTTERVLVWTAGTVTSLEFPLTGVEPGAVACPVEVSETEPLLRSAWLTL